MNSCAIVKMAAIFDTSIDRVIPQIITRSTVKGERCVFRANGALYKVRRSPDVFYWADIMPNHIDSAIMVGVCFEASQRFGLPLVIGGLESGEAKELVRRINKGEKFTYQDALAVVEWNDYRSVHKPDHHVHQEVARDVFRFEDVIGAILNAITEIAKRARFLSATIGPIMSVH